MKVFLNLFIMLAFLASCNQTPGKVDQKTKSEELPAGYFGKEIPAEQAVAASEIIGLFADSDTVEVTISGNINAACKHSGCWMDLDMGKGEILHVTFHEESFTIPLDAAGKNAVAEGIAIRELIPVEFLRKYAREEGKSREEVEMITEPVYKYEFIATGVLIED
jgi:hypothetical protein